MLLLAIVNHTMLTSDQVSSPLDGKSLVNLQNKHIEYDFWLFFLAVSYKFGAYKSSLKQSDIKSN